MTSKQFWKHKSLAELSEEEWEALCDGCGRCCLRKLENEDSGEIAYTDVSCRLLNTETCRCTRYPQRLKLVKDCVGLRPDQLEQLQWMPTSCAYRLLDAGLPLPDWHPLVSGTNDSVHEAGISVRGRCTSEEHVHENEIEHRLIEWITVKN